MPYSCTAERNHGLLLALPVGACWRRTFRRIHGPALIGPSEEVDGRRLDLLPDSVVQALAVDLSMGVVDQLAPLDQAESVELHVPFHSARPYTPDEAQPPPTRKRQKSAVKTPPPPKTEEGNRCFSGPATSEEILLPSDLFDARIQGMQGSSLVDLPAAHAVNSDGPGWSGQELHSMVDSPKRSMLSPA